MADHLLHHHLRHLRDVQLSDEQVLFVQEREEGKGVTILSDSNQTSAQTIPCLKSQTIGVQKKFVNIHEDYAAVVLITADEVFCDDKFPEIVANVFEAT